MIFFREHRALILFRQNPESMARGFFVFVRADLQGPIDSESGMTINLMDVDRELKKALHRPTVYKGRQHFLKSLFRQLWTTFPNKLKSLTLGSGSATLSYDGASFCYQYRTTSFFCSAQGWVQRAIILETSQVLKSAWIRDFANRHWESDDMCIEALGLMRETLKSIQIEKAEQKGWERWRWEA